MREKRCGGREGMGTVLLGPGEEKAEGPVLNLLKHMFNLVALPKLPST